MKFEFTRDFESEGQVPLVLDRQYRSFNTRDGIFGRYWESNFDYTLTLPNSTDVQVYMPGRGTVTFLPTTPNNWAASTPGAAAQLVKDGAGIYTLSWNGDSVQTYDPSGKVTSIKSPFGTGYDFAYTSGKLTRVTATGGRFISFNWSGTQLTSVSSPDGRVYGYSYAANKFGTGKNLLTGVTFPGTTSAAVTYVYENASFPGALTGKLLAGQRISKYAFDGNGRATTTEEYSTTALNVSVNKYIFSYSTPSTGVLDVLETNPLGKQASYHFMSGRLLSVTGLPSASCPSSLYTKSLDANGFPDVVTDFNNHMTNVDYDASGRLLSETVGYGTSDARTKTQQWDIAHNRLTLQTISGDSAVSYGYTPEGRLQTVSTQNLSGYGSPNQVRTTTHSYTTQPNGLLATHTEDGPISGTGDAVTETYNSSGDLISVSDALGVVSAMSNFDGMGRPGRVSYPNGVTLDIVYDERGRVRSATRTSGGQVAAVNATYDSRGRLSSSSDPFSGRTITALTYDNADRLTKSSSDDSDIIDSTDPNVTIQSQTSEVALTYTANNNVASVATTRKQVQSYFVLDVERTRTVVIASAKKSYVYDELGRLKAEQGNTGQNFRNSYDESGYITKATDSLARDTSIARDRLDRPVSITDAKNGVTALHYDLGGRVDRITDPKGYVTRYFYDGFGELIRTESPDAGNTSMTYDSAGRIQSSVGADLQAYSYAVDGMGRVTSVQAGTVVQTFVFDSCANGMRMLCSASDANGTVQNAYTPAGQVSQRTQVISGVAYTSQYAYDASDHLSSLTYPDGSIVQYTYLDGRLRSITNNSGVGPVAIVDTMQYQPWGALFFERFGNGAYRQVDYDTDARPTSMKTLSPAGALLQGLALGYDANNLITSIANTRPGGISQAFQYDELGRLVQASRNDGVTESFTYDANGNRTSSSKSGVTTTFGYPDPNNRLAQSSAPGLSRIWTYDDRGNVSGLIGPDGVAVGFHFDAFGRIDGSSRLGSSVFYIVNPLGERVSKAGPDGTYRFIYDPWGSIIAQVRSGSSWTNYIWDGETLVATAQGSSLTFVHGDQLGRPEVLTNSSGNVIASANNFAFDRTITSSLNWGLPGQYNETETGTWLWQNGFRYYDSSTGRYLQADPIGLAGGLNPYAYVGGDPVDSIDPFGLCKCEGMGQAPSPQAYAKYGQKVGSTPGYIGPALFWGFRRGGTLDAQVRYGGSPAYANYVFGVALSAAGYGLSSTLKLADDYGAARSSYGSHVAMDSKYTSIPSANVANITAGYKDQKAGTLCTP